MSTNRSLLPTNRESLADNQGKIGAPWYRFLAKIERLIGSASASAGTGLDVTDAGVLTIAPDGVSNAMLRESVAVSVIGNAYNDTRNPQDISAAANGRVLQRNNDMLEFGHVRLASFLKTTVPSAVSYGAGTLVFITNETGGATPAFSDGTNWRRFADRAIIS